MTTIKNLHKTLFIILLLFSTTCFAQESTNTSGGEATGSNGMVSYSIGQVDYINASSQEGNINQGVQQPYEFYTIGLANLEEIELSAYPNPTTGLFKLTIQNGFVGSVSYELVDKSGRVIDNAIVLNKEESIDLSTYSSGIYLLNVVIDSSKTKTFKIVKQ